MNASPVGQSTVRRQIVSSVTLEIGQDVSMRG